MSTSQQLHILALVAFVCFFVGVTIGWTWYLEAVCWMVVVVFWTTVGLSWWTRKHAHTEHSPSMRDDAREGVPACGDADPAEHHEAAPLSISVNTPLSEHPDSAPLQSRALRVLFEVVVSLPIFIFLVFVGHLNVFFALGAVLTGKALAILLMLRK
jgi:hypothetical protein